MKKLVRLLLLNILLIIVPTIAYADCESEFKEVESEFSISYEYNTSNKSYTITLVNPDYNKYSFVFNNTEEIENANMSVDGTKLTAVISNYKGESYPYKISGVVNECAGIILKNEVFVLKKVNKYADSPLCEGNEEFVLCQKDYGKEIDEATFESRIKQYEKAKEAGDTVIDDDIPSKNKDEPTTSTIQSIIKIVKEHKWIVGVAIGVLIIIILSVVLIVKREMKRRRLK